jgi:hypothetical protein
MDYVYDVLCILCEEKLLSSDDTKSILELIQRTGDGTSIWNSK